MRNWLSCRRTALLICLCVCLLGCGSMARAESRAGRELLEDALMQHRLRELGVLTLRESYLAHARTLADEPQKAGIAWCYVGLAELQGRDVLAALESFQRCSKLLNGPATQADEGLAAARADARRLAGEWIHRLSQPGSIAVSISELSEARCRPAIAVVVVRLGAAPGKSRPDPATVDDDTIEYRFRDPADFVETTRLAALSLPMNGVSAEDRLLIAWRALLLEDFDAATTALTAAENQHAQQPVEDSLTLELQCLQLTYSLRYRLAGSPADDEIRPLQLAPWLPLWGLRALSLAPAQDERVLPVAQQSIRGLIGDKHPFESQLLFPQDRERLMKSEYLRDCYWEIGVLHAVRAASANGMWLKTPLSADFVRAERLLSELNSPLRRGRTPLSPLRQISLALACAHCGDFESWQGNALGSKVGAWSEVLDGARVIAGDRRTRSPGELLDRNAEVQVELPETLLLGEGEVLPGGGELASSAPQEAVEARFNGWWWVLGVALIGIFGCGVWLRGHYGRR